MRIVQTFWTGGRSPKEHSFGWLHPEYNLMSWALSCLSLREHYDKVVLYTDKEGYKVLIEELQLPYTEVHVEYDEHLCLPQHWAYSKIKTYSLQTEPFLHIDGDIYLPKPLPESVMDAPLVAQNREIGTGYYRRMMDRILSYPEIILPKYILEGLRDNSIASYNMGIFGGNDIVFVQDYCRKVFKFMQANHMNDGGVSHSNVDCNVFFEQLMFAAIADSQKRDVASVLGRAMKDEGYTQKDFCDLLSFENKQFFHILGGHKQRETTCKGLSLTLLRLYPDSFEKVVSLFPHRHPRLNGSVHFLPCIDISPRCDDVLIDVSIQEMENQWKRLDARDLLQQARQLANFVHFRNASRIERRSFEIEINPLLFQKRTEPDGKYICCVPNIWELGTSCCTIGDMGWNILILLSSQGRMKYETLRSTLKPYLGNRLKKYPKTSNNLIFKEIIYLLYYGIILNY